MRLTGFFIAVDRWPLRRRAQGASIIQTDQPAAVIAYLKSIGRH